MYPQPKVVIRRKQSTWPLVFPTLVFVFGVSFILTYLGVLTYDMIVVDSKSSSSRRAEMELLGQKIVPGVAISLETTHILCNHAVTETLERPEDWTGRPFRELLQRYPEKEGWQWELKPGQIILRRAVPGFCADDSNKRHLGVAGGVIAIIIGPPGINGGIDRLTQIQAQRLPTALRHLAEAGLLDFSSEEELLQVLDGMDESDGRKEKESPEKRRIF